MRSKEFRQAPCGYCERLEDEKPGKTKAATAWPSYFYFPIRQNRADQAVPDFPDFPPISAISPKSNQVASNFGLSASMRKSNLVLITRFAERVVGLRKAEKISSHHHQGEVSLLSAA